MNNSKDCFKFIRPFARDFNCFRHHKNRPKRWQKRSSSRSSLKMSLSWARRRRRWRKKAQTQWRFLLTRYMFYSHHPEASEFLIKPRDDREFSFPSPPPRTFFMPCRSQLRKVCCSSEFHGWTTRHASFYSTISSSFRLEKQFFLLLIATNLLCL